MKKVVMVLLAIASLVYTDWALAGHHNGSSTGGNSSGRSYQIGGQPSSGRSSGGSLGRNYSGYSAGRSVYQGNAYPGRQSYFAPRSAYRSIGQSSSNRNSRNSDCSNRRVIYPPYNSREHSSGGGQSYKNYVRRPVYFNGRSSQNVGQSYQGERPDIKSYRGGERSSKINSIAPQGDGRASSSFQGSGLSSYISDRLDRGAQVYYKEHQFLDNNNVLREWRGYVEAPTDYSGSITQEYLGSLPIIETEVIDIPQSPKDSSFKQKVIGSWTLLKERVSAAKAEKKSVTPPPEESVENDEVRTPRTEERIVIEERTEERTVEPTEEDEDEEDDSLPADGWKDHLLLIGTVLAAVIAIIWWLVIKFKKP